MTNDKKPSIYSDRGSIGSAEELDEYGVWVKSEPQILGADKSSDLDDSILPVDDAAASDESISFDDAVLDLNEASKPTFSESIEFPDDDIEIDLDNDPLTNPADLDDFNMPLDDDLGFVSTDDSFQDESLDIEDTTFDEFEVPVDSSSDFADDDLSSEDFSSVEFDSGTETEDDISIDIDQDDLTIEQDDISIDQDDISIDDDLTIEQDDDISIDNDDISIDIDDFTSEQDDDITIDQDDISIDDDDFSVPTVKSIENNNISNAQSGDGELSTQLLKKIASELSSIRSELTDLKKEFANVHFTAAEESKTDERGGFFSEEDDEKIALTGDELDNILGDTPADADADIQEQPKETYFDDDDDEAIALTGDELDNILNSADFTEESGTDETPESDLDADLDTDMDLDIDLDTESLSMDDIDLAPEFRDDVSEEVTEEVIEEPAEDNIDIEMDDIGLTDIDDISDDSLSLDDSFDASLQDSLDEPEDSVDELDKLREEGATPITLAPDNSSYLEEGSDDETIDFSDAVIDEPELSTENIVDTLSEPETEFDLDSLDDLDDLTIEPQDELETELMDEPDLVDEVEIEPEPEVVEEAEEEIEEVSEIEDEPVLEADDGIDALDDFEVLDDVSDDVLEEATPYATNTTPEWASDGAAEDPMDFPVAPDDDWEPQQAPSPIAPPSQPVTASPQAGFVQSSPGKEQFEIPSDLRSELRNILSYMDQLLESLPEEKIEEFAKSEYFDSYKKLFKELGLV